MLRFGCTWLDRETNRNLFSSWLECEIFFMHRIKADPVPLSKAAKSSQATYYSKVEITVVKLEIIFIAIHVYF